MIRAVQQRRDAVAAGVALVGLVVACLIYVSAQPATSDADARLEDSKQYVRQMEVYGGTANVLASELRQWFGGLWHGRSLAYTVAFIGLVVGAGTRLALTPLPPLSDGSGTGQRRDGDTRQYGPGQPGRPRRRD